MRFNQVCVKCHRFFKAYKNGVAVEEGMPTSGGGWVSYKLWMADITKCEGCGAEVLTGFSAEPVAQHFQSDYAAKLRSFKPIFRIDDSPGIFNPQFAEAHRQFTDV